MNTFKTIIWCLINNWLHDSKYLSITKQFMHKIFIWGSFLSLNIGTLKFTKLKIIYSLDSWNEPTRKKSSFPFGLIVWFSSCHISYYYPLDKCLLHKWILISFINNVNCTINPYQSKVCEKMKINKILCKESLSESSYGP